MEALQIVLGIILGIIAIVIIVLILFQQGHRAGLNGTISGAADTFLSKNKARTIDAKLKRLTTLFAILFVVISIVTAIVAAVGHAH